MMNKSLLVVVSLLLAGSLPTLRAQTGDDWSRVLALKPGKRITLRTAAEPQRVRGRLHAAGPETITLMDRSRNLRTFDRSQVTLVRLRRSNAWPIGGAAAASVAPAVVLVTADHALDTYIGVRALPVFSVAGALIGKVVQRSAAKTIYKARP